MLKQKNKQKKVECLFYLHSTFKGAVHISVSFYFNNSISFSNCIILEFIWILLIIIVINNIATITQVILANFIFSFNFLNIVFFIKLVKVSEGC